MYVVGPLSGLDQDKDIHDFCTVFPFKINMTACAQKKYDYSQRQPEYVSEG